MRAEPQLGSNGVFPTITGVTNTGIPVLEFFRTFHPFFPPGDALEVRSGKPLKKCVPSLRVGIINEAEREN